jgi:hypothetical protein
MKKLLCSLLALVICLSCLAGCPAPVKPLTAADIVAHVNQSVQSLNDINFSTVTPEEIAGETVDINAVIEEVKKLKGQLTLTMEAGGNSTDTTGSLSEGVLHIPNELGIDTYMTVVGDALAVFACAERGGETFANVQYMLLSAMLGQTQMPTLPSDEENPLAGLDLSLPLMTEEDVTVEGTTFVIKNSYITSVVKSALDALPEELIADTQGIAALKTMLPGLLDNLGLRISLETKGDKIVGNAVTFDANKDFNTLLEIPADIVIKGGYAVALSDDGEKLRGLQMDLEITGVIDFGFAADVIYTERGLETATLDFDCNLSGVEIATESIPYYDEWGYYNEFYYAVEADMAINLDLTLLPGALSADAPLDAALLNGSFKMSTKNSVAMLDGEPAEDDDPVANALLDSAVSGGEITVASSKSAANTTAITVEMHMADGTESRVTLTLMLGDAPAFVAPPAEASAVLQEEYLALYEELLTAAANSGLFGGFDYLTEDGNTVSFVYYGIADSFTVTTGNSTNPYNYHIVNLHGEYVVQES